MKLTSLTLTLITIGTLAFTSCKKDDVPDNNGSCPGSDLAVELEVSGSTVTGFSITSFASGGSGQISRTWSTGQTTAFTLTDLSEGTYSLEVEDEEGCTASASVTITPTPTVSDIDGNKYDVVVISSQTWLAQNVNTTRFRNGDPIPTGINTSNSSPAREVQSSGGTSYSSTVHGTHYNWYAINNPRGICPQGYHVASEAEWNTLVNGLGGSNTAGNQMKRVEMDFIAWGAAVGNTVVGNNSSGFSAVPSGFTNDVNNFVGASVTASFWTSTQGNTNEGVVRQLEKWDGQVDSGERFKGTGHSCRCIKD